VNWSYYQLCVSNHYTGQPTKSSTITGGSLSITDNTVCQCSKLFTKCCALFFICLKVDNSASVLKPTPVRPRPCLHGKQLQRQLSVSSIDNHQEVVRPLKVSCSSLYEQFINNLCSVTFSHHIMKVFQRRLHCHLVTVNHQQVFHPR